VKKKSTVLYGDNSGKLLLHANTENVVVVVVVVVVEVVVVTAAAVVTTTTATTTTTTTTRRCQNLHGLQKTAILGTAHILQKVLM
jgi:hypothetical protein